MFFENNRIQWSITILNNGQVAYKKTYKTCLIFQKSSVKTGFRQKIWQNIRKNWLFWKCIYENVR